MSQTVALPDEVASLLGADRDRKVLEAVLVQLYRDGRIGSGAVATLLGMTREAAIRWLGEQGAPYFDETAHELAEDARRAGTLGNRP